MGFKKDYGASSNLADGTCNASLDTLKAGELLRGAARACREVCSDT